MSDRYIVTPNRTIADPDQFRDLEDALQYTSEPLSVMDRLDIAALIRAYRFLYYLPIAKRNEVIREMKDAAERKATRALTNKITRRGK